jgi:hypothetical protein
MPRSGPRLRREPVRVLSASKSRMTSYATPAPPHAVPRREKIASITLMALGLLAAVVGFVGTPSPAWHIPLRFVLGLGVLLMALGSYLAKRARHPHA